ncbi:MAG: RNA methyltransferase [Marinilabiliales bacterium]
MSDINNKLIEYLKEFVTPEKYQLFLKIVESRTRYLTVVLEDIYQPQNASAVLRTCDCYGVQNIHIIENRNKYRLNPDVTLGSDKWLSLHRYNTSENNTLSAIDKLKKEGYRIVATAINKENYTLLPEFNISKGKFALLFGSELLGLSDAAFNNADEFLKIPMYGFTESFNISVSAAIILSNLVEKLRESDVNWRLSQQEKTEIVLQWLKITIKKSDLLIEKYFEINNFPKS